MVMWRNILLCMISVVVSACSGKPSESDMKQLFVKELKQAKYDKDTRRTIKLVSFEKTNGQVLKRFGIEGYQAEYKAKIEFLMECWEPQVVTPFSKRKFVCYRQKPTRVGFFVPTYIQRKKGETDMVRGKYIFEKTDKGWRAQDGTIF